jgi:hypothetical protein
VCKLALGGQQLPLQQIWPDWQQLSPQMLQQPVAVHRCPFVAQQKRFWHLLNLSLQPKPQLPLTQVGVEFAGACR